MVLIGSAILVAFSAFLLIPGLGGFRTRTRWRRFRERIRQSALHPAVPFDAVGPDGPLGPHRFIGRIEALQGSDSLWIQGDHLSLQAQMSGAKIYLLPTEGVQPPNARALLEERLPEDQPRSLPWKRITSLQEGTRVYLDGFLERRGGVLRMYGSRDVPLLALLHEGEDVVPRAVWAGRQKNEYWNPITPWALLAGSLALFIMASAVFGIHRSSTTARYLLAAALAPVIPILPPGLAFFLLYMSQWRRARFLRAERDLLGLIAFLRAGDATEEMLGWGDDLPQDTVPLIRNCRRRARATESGAALSFVAGFAMNTALVLLILDAVL